MYDKKMWDDDGAWIQPPTVRSVADIALDIVGDATGQKWLGWVDDALFGLIDVSGGYKTAQEVGLELGKKALTQVVSSTIGGATDWAKDAAGKALKSAGTAANVATQAGISVASSYASSVTSSAINSFNIVDGELKFDGKGFGKSLYSASTIGGALGAGITAGLNEYSLGARTVDGLDADGNAIKTNEYTRAQGLNSTQIDNMGKFNSLMGGLSSSAVSFAMDGEATFNLLNISDFGVKSNTGLFELTVGKKGVSSRIGTGGTNISMGNLKASINGGKAAAKSGKINSLVNKEYGGNQNIADALRMQYGFGDQTQNILLNDILNGKAELIIGETDGRAQTVLDGDIRKIYLNESDVSDWQLAGLMLGHEAYRNGILDDTESQLAETRAAVAGHTDMTLRMMGDNLYAASMAQLVGSNQNLQIDLLARSLGDDIFNSYVDGTYESSADYWKLTFDGQLISDGSGWLKDEDGKYINIDGTRSDTPEIGKTLGAEKQESGLLNILNGTSGKGYDTFSDRKKIQAQQLMHAAGLSMDSKGQWNNLKDKKLDMNLVMEYSGNSVASEVFARYYDSTVDSYIASTLGLDIGDVEGRYVPHNSAMEDRMMRFTNAKMSFYKSSGAFVDEKYTMISQSYNKFSEGNYSNYKGFHYGIDIVSITGKEGAPILAGLSGKVTENFKDSGKKEGGGNAIHMQYGYNFESSFIGIGIHGEYDHLQKQSEYQNGDFISPNTKIGIMGDTGNSTAPHLHYSVYTSGINNYSKTSMKILFGSDYNSTIMRSGTYDSKTGNLKYWNNKYVYNPEPFYFRTKK